MSACQQFLQAPELISFVIHYLLEPEAPADAPPLCQSDPALQRYHLYRFHRQQLPCSSLCPICRVGQNALSMRKECCYTTSIAQTLQRQNLKALTRLILVCKNLFILVTPILWQHLDLMTTTEVHSVYEQKRLRRWLQSILWHGSRNCCVYPSSQVWSPVPLATMGQHIGRKGVGIGVGYFVKVFQLSRSIWCSLDRRSLEAMHQVFPSISTLHVLDEVELGGVDPQELRGIPGDSLNTPYDCMDRCNTKARDQCQVYTTEDQVSQLCLQFEDLVSPRQLPPVQKIEDSLQNLARWFPRLEDPVLPERGLMASAADINSSGPGGKKRTLLESKVTKQGSLKEEPRHTIDINSNMINITGLDYSVNEQKDHHRDYMKRVRLSDQLDTQISRQIFSSTHPGPWLLQDCSPGNGITAHAAQFRNLAHVSCPFESIGLLSLDLILNQMSMPCLVSVEIRARPSLIYTVLAQSQGLCLDLGDAGTKSPLTQSIDLMRKALGRGCTRDLQQIDVPDIVEYGHGYGDCECQCYHGVLESEYHSMAVREITERHSSTLRRLSLWRDGLSRDISMP